MKTLEEWGNLHALRFGFAPSFYPMVAAWVEEFAATGYTIAELQAATLAIAKSESSPRYPGDHYAAIHRAVQSQRFAEREKFATERTRRQTHTDGHGICEGCGDTGWFIVPHVDRIGAWCDAARFVTGTVACSCFIGRKIVETWDAKRPLPLTIGVYEARVPNWRELVEFERTVKRARCKTAGKQTAFAKTVDEIQRRAKAGAA